MLTDALLAFSPANGQARERVPISIAVRAADALRDMMADIRNNDSSESFHRSSAMEPAPEVRSAKRRGNFRDSDVEGGAR